MAELPASASVVVVGGGVMGLSTAYHLGRGGVTDVVVLERHTLGSGSTCKAAGGVRAQFSDPVNIELGQRSLRAYERFADEFGQEIDLHKSGYLFLLDDPDHVAAFEANVALQSSMGVPSRMISAAEAKRLSPMVDLDGILAAAWSPEDGHCTPESVVLGYAGGARRAGVRIVTHCAVTGVEVVDGQVRGVLTDAGRIATDTIVCAAGAWSRAVGEMVGVDLPVVPLRRQILTTEPMPGLDPATPFTIDFATSLYFHLEGPGLLLGMSDPDEVPGFEVGRTDAWLPRLGDAIARRVPALAEVGIASGWAGLYEMTPDHNALVGEAAGVSRFLYATGFSGHGFLMGPAIGEVLRDLVLGRHPVVDVNALSVDRFADRGVRPELNIV
ncbi:FAD-binding oxidoreductase [Nocardioides endophyticus]|uniref:FAD-binding oxidoreductase n=1 Tax=Nocardioides endophyticus TaxID=1353775 RepID=A0ABP8YFZ5_9ACTN